MPDGGCRETLVQSAASVRGLPRATTGSGPRLRRPGAPWRCAMAVAGQARTPWPGRRARESACRETRRSQGLYRQCLVIGPTHPIAGPHSRPTVIVSEGAAELGSSLNWVTVRPQTSVAGQDHPLLSDLVAIRLPASCAVPVASPQ